MSYPASLQIDTPERIANWRPLVQWLLAIPHFVVLGVLRTVSTVVVIVGWFAVAASTLGTFLRCSSGICATRQAARWHRWPSSDVPPLQHGVVNAYVTTSARSRSRKPRTLRLILTDAVSAETFNFDTTAGRPRRVGSPSASANFSPALDSRNRLTVLFRAITLIPAYIFTVVIGIVGAVCLVLGFFAVLFSGRWPAGLRKMVIPRSASGQPHASAPTVVIGIVGAVCLVLGFFAVLFSPLACRAAQDGGRSASGQLRFTRAVTDQYPPFSID